ncbi:MAG: phytanoyl-CoA dioxygenase family protein [Candidatus Eremiobacteraeota bacterium]|nr:phytanoyl-CoA dioxygenase family protein [Candidatus Eremiobacteraeota bacterium]
MVLQAAGRLKNFQEQGFIIIPGFKAASEISALRQRAAQIVDGFDPSQAASIFTTKNQAQHSDRYFLESGDKVRCFFEEDAFDQAGALKYAKALSINKIGHALHDVDPVFDRFSRDPRLADLCAELGLLQPLLYQSMYIFKQPQIGGEVHWHQDATFFLTDPISVITFWFALEDADQTNGCLWTQPGAHRSPLRQRFVVSNGVAALEVVDSTPWPSSDAIVPLEVRAGDLVVFCGLLPHYSAPNRSTQSRHAYTLHIVDGMTTYSPANWLQRATALPARGF